MDLHKINTNYPGKITSPVRLWVQPRGAVSVFEVTTILCSILFPKHSTATIVLNSPHTHPSPRY